MSSPGNLNIPPNSIADSKGKGMLWSAFASWIASVTTVANWIVTGMLNAGTLDAGTLNAGTLDAGTLNAGTLMLSQEVATPAAGQIGAGDKAYIEIGSGGGAPAFTNSWVNSGGAGFATAAFIKTADGTVHLKGSIGSGASGSIAFTLPVGYRPLKTMRWTADDDDATNTTVATIDIASTGAVTVFYAVGAVNIWLTTVSFPAEQ